MVVASAGVKGVAFVGKKGMNWYYNLILVDSASYCDYTFSKCVPGTHGCRCHKKCHCS